MDYIPPLIGFYYDLVRGEYFKVSSLHPALRSHYFYDTVADETISASCLRGDRFYLCLPHGKTDPTFWRSRNNAPSVPSVGSQKVLLKKKQYGVQCHKPGRKGKHVHHQNSLNNTRSPGYCASRRFSIGHVFGSANVFHTLENMRMVNFTSKKLRKDNVPMHNTSYFLPDAVSSDPLAASMNQSRDCLVVSSSPSQTSNFSSQISGHVNHKVPAMHDSSYCTAVQDICLARLMLWRTNQKFYAEGMNLNHQTLLVPCGLRKDHNFRNFRSALLGMSSTYNDDCLRTAMLDNGSTLQINSQHIFAHSQKRVDSLTTQHTFPEILFNVGWKGQYPYIVLHHGADMVLTNDFSNYPLGVDEDSSLDEIRKPMVRTANPSSAPLHVCDQERFFALTTKREVCVCVDPLWNEQMVFIAVRRRRCNKTDFLLNPTAVCRPFVSSNGFILGRCDGSMCYVQRENLNLLSHTYSVENRICTAYEMHHKRMHVLSTHHNSGFLEMKALEDCTFLTRSRDGECCLFDIRKSQYPVHIYTTGDRSRALQHVALDVSLQDSILSVASPLRESSEATLSYFHIPSGSHIASYRLPVMPQTRGSYHSK